MDVRVGYDSWQIPQRKSLAIIRRNVCSVWNGYCIVTPEKSIGKYEGLIDLYEENVCGRLIHSRLSRGFATYVEQVLQQIPTKYSW